VINPEGVDVNAPPARVGVGKIMVTPGSGRAGVMNDGAEVVAAVGAGSVRVGLIADAGVPSDCVGRVSGEIMVTGGSEVPSSVGKAGFSALSSMVSVII
jgi:hypothetical protein